MNINENVLFFICQNESNTSDNTFRVQFVSDFNIYKFDQNDLERLVININNILIDIKNNTCTLRVLIDLQKLDNKFLSFYYNNIFEKIIAIRKKIRIRIKKKININFEVWFLVQNMIENDINFSKISNDLDYSYLVDDNLKIDTYINPVNKEEEENLQFLRSLDPTKLNELRNDNNDIFTNIINQCSNQPLIFKNCKLSLSRCIFYSKVQFVNAEIYIEDSKFYSAINFYNITTNQENQNIVYEKNVYFLNCKFFEMSFKIPTNNSFTLIDERIFMDEPKDIRIIFNKSFIIENKNIKISTHTSKISLINFSNADFNSDFILKNLLIDSLFLSNLKFLKNENNETNIVSFENSLISEIYFRNCVFEKVVLFGYSNFKYTSFKDTKFKELANFANAKFEENLVFEYTNIENVNFSNSVFEKKVYFSYSVFEKNVDFSNCVFKKNVDFSNCVFEKTNFYNTKFKELADFANAKFEENIVFQKTDFEKVVVFSAAIFSENVIFMYCKFQDHLVFRNTEFKKGIDISTSLITDINKINIFNLECFNEKKIKLENGENNDLKNFIVIKDESDNSKYETKMSDEGKITLQNARETFRIFKASLDAQNNQIDALKYQALENEVYLLQLKQDRLKHFTEYIILILNKRSNNFKKSWIWGILFTIISGGCFYIFVLLLSKPTVCDKDKISFFFKYLMPIEISNESSIEILKSSHMSDELLAAHFLYYFGKIIIAFGYYQTISAFRKFKSI